jgi:hypothetical protein
MADLGDRAHTGINGTSCKEATWASTVLSDLTPTTSIG